MPLFETLTWGRDMTFRELLRRRILTLLQERDITQMEFSTRLGHSASWLNQIVTGERGKTFDRLDDIASGFGMDIVEFLDPPPRRRIPLGPPTDLCDSIHTLICASALSPEDATMMAGRLYHLMRDPSTFRPARDRRACDTPGPRALVPSATRR